MSKQKDVKKTHQIWSQPADPNASLLSRLYSLIGTLNDASDVLKSWPAEEGNAQEGKESEKEKMSGHLVQTTKLMNELTQAVTNLQAVEERVHEIQEYENKLSTFDESQQIAESVQQPTKVLSSPVPLDLLMLLDFGANKSDSKGLGINPECFAQCLLAETSRQLVGLRRRKNALEKLGKTLDEGRKNQSTDVTRSITNEVLSNDSIEIESHGVKRTRENTDEGELNDLDSTQPTKQQRKI